MLWKPTAKVEVAKVALPPLRLAVPSVVAPSRNVTVPVAVPVAGETADTWAVNVTNWVFIAGFNELVTATELAAFVMVWVMAADELLAKLLSPA